MKAIVPICSGCGMFIENATVVLDDLYNTPVVTMFHGLGCQSWYERWIRAGNSGVKNTPDFNKPMKKSRRTRHSP